jgi:hypothetical protein
MLLQVLFIYIFEVLLSSIIQLWSPTREPRLASNHWASVRWFNLCMSKLSFLPSWANSILSQSRVLKHSAIVSLDTHPLTLISRRRAVWNYRFYLASWAFHHSIICAHIRVFGHWSAMLSYHESSFRRRDLAIRALLLLYQFPVAVLKKRRGFLHFQELCFASTFGH